MDAKSVVAKYRELIFQYKKVSPIRPSYRVPQDVQVAKSFLGWCEGHMVDPGVFMELRFLNLHRYRQTLPGFRSLRNENLVPIAQREQASRAAEDTHTPNFDQAVRDLSLMSENQERVRKRYFSQAKSELCLESSYAGGFDPRSQFCPQCPQAGTCAARLNRRHSFDVVALRAGRVQSLPAVVMKALRGWDGSISV